MNTEGIKWGVKTTLEKRHGDVNQCKTPDERKRFYEENKPYEVLVEKGNCLLNEGMDAALGLITGYGSETAFNNTNARIGVGNSATAAARTQNDLQGASKAYKAMMDGFPTVPAENSDTDGRSVKFKSEWADAEGNFVWAEWSVDNGSVAAVNLNRKVAALGTKSSGTWTLQVEISLK